MPKGFLHCSMVKNLPNSVVKEMKLVWSLGQEDPLCSTLCNSTDCSLQGSSVRGIFRQEHWSGLPFLPSEDLPDPGIKPRSPVPTAFAGRFFTTEPPGKPLCWYDSHQSLLIHNDVKDSLHSMVFDLKKDLQKEYSKWWQEIR